jgi:hypothetical protein
MSGHACGGLITWMWTRTARRSGSSRSSWSSTAPATRPSGTELVASADDEHAEGELRPELVRCQVETTTSIRHDAAHRPDDLGVAYRPALPLPQEVLRRTCGGPRGKGWPGECLHPVTGELAPMWTLIADFAAGYGPR